MLAFLNARTDGGNGLVDLSPTEFAYVDGGHEPVPPPNDGKEYCFVRHVSDSDGQHCDAYKVD